MDDVDRQIVALMRQDARRSFQNIGLRVSLSAPAVKRRVDRLEAAGVIRGYSARVDPGRFGWRTHAIVALFCVGGMAAA
jgi:DNA-binding Lrp family transcriptional regulator